MIHLFALVFALNAHAADNVNSAFHALVSAPSTTALTKFQNACEKPGAHLNFQEAKIKMASLRSNSALAKEVVFALVKAYSRCSDGEQQGLISDILGNHAALYNATDLINALWANPPVDKGVSFMETIDEDRFSVYCKNDACKKHREEYFSQKSAAISSANPDAAAESLRKTLSAALDKFAARQ